MKKRLQRAIPLVLIVLLASVTLLTPALAVTEEEVEGHIAVVGKEAATGNLFLWFLCAVAFLKASQKIDSFMSALGISVGHTGGSMLAEAMIVARGAGAVKDFNAGGHFSSHGSRAGGSGGGGSPSSPGGGTGGGVFSGGLAGMVGRWAANSAARSVTQPGGGGNPGAAPGSAPSGVPGSAPPGPSAASAAGGGGAPVGVPGPGAAARTKVQGQECGAAVSGSQAGGVEDEEMEQIWRQIEHAHGIGTEVDAEDMPTSVGGPDESAQGQTAAPSDLVSGDADGVAEGRSLGRRVFDRSLAQGGAFATRVIGSIALGSAGRMGTMTGPTAAAALASYMGGAVASPACGNAVPSGGHSGAAPTGTPVSGGESVSGGMSEAVISGGGVPTDSIPGGGDFASGDTGAVVSTPIANGTGAPETSAPGITSAPTYDQVEIGGGRITGVEYSQEMPEGAKFAMYSSTHYAEPEEEFSTLTAKDGSKWYKQYAQETVQRKPYQTEDGEIKYHEKLVKKLPKTPHRKDRA